MIRVVHIITDLDTGGAEMMLYRLLSRIDTSRFQNVVVSMRDEGTLGSAIKARGIPVLSLNMSRGIPDPKGLFILAWLLRKERPDIIQTWLYHADLLGLLAGKLLRIPNVVWNIRCSDLSTEDHPGRLFVMLKSLARLSHLPKAVVINSSKGRLAHAKLGYQPQRWELIPNGFDLAEFHPDEQSRQSLRKSLGLELNAPLIGLIGRFNPMKDHGNFLKAASLTRKSRADVHFVMAGKGVDASNTLLMNHIRQLDLNDNIHLLGERKDIPFVTSALDIACSSSYSEGFPNTVGEAMSCGVPCVVTDVGESAFIVGDTGSVVPPRSPEAMATAFLKVLSMNEEERREIGKAARQRIIEKFSIDTVTWQYERLYEDICDGKK